MNRSLFGSLGAIALAGILPNASTANGQSITRASIDSSGNQVALGGHHPAISADGVVVAFTSSAPDLVAGDTNGFQDVFVHDRKTGLTERVSVSSAGVEGNADSSIAWAPVISSDGRFVAFHSGATNLVAGDTNKRWDIFVRDRLNGTTERISVSSSGAASNGNSFYPGITPDGRFVSFQSEGTNLVTGDTNAVADVFVHDRSTGATERVSVDSSGVEGNALSYCLGTSISANGDVVTFGSLATNLVAGDTNNDEDCFVHVRSTGATVRVSVDSSGNEGDRGSKFPAISDDGMRIVFTGRATNLVAGDTNGWADVFVHDRGTGATTRVSVDSAGGESNGTSAEVNPPTISGDGNVVGFDSEARNLVAFDDNDLSDAFRHDLTTGKTTILSQTCANNSGDAGSFGPSVSSDGSQAAYFGAASNLVAGDTNGTDDVMATDLNVPPDLAFWANYGSGFPGTLGVPSLTLNAQPVFGTDISIDIGNSLGSPTIGILFFGYTSIDIPTSAIGHILASPDAALAGPLQTGTTSFLGSVPRDETLCGVSIFLQVLELDPGSTHGISFSQGMEMHFGQ